MSSGSNSTGRDYLARLSLLTALRKSLPPIKDVLVIEDETFDSDRMQGTLRKIFGQTLEIRKASTLTSALDRVLDRKPELIILDDYLMPSDTALDTIPLLRRAQYEGPIIVVSGRLTRNRKIKLREVGAAASIHKDELDGGSIVEALTDTFLGGLPPELKAELESGAAKGERG